MSLAQSGPVAHSMQPANVTIRPAHFAAASIWCDCIARVLGVPVRPRCNASVVLVPALLCPQMRWQALLRGMRSHGLSWLLAGVLLGERRYMGGAQIQCPHNVLVESNESSLAMLRQSFATGPEDNGQHELLRPSGRHGQSATGSGQNSTKFSGSEVVQVTRERTSFMPV